MQIRSDWLQSGPDLAAVTEAWIEIEMEVDSDLANTFDFAMSSWNQLKLAKSQTGFEFEMMDKFEKFPNWAFLPVIST